LVAPAVVIRHLLIEVSADARGKAQRKMLIDSVAGTTSSTRVKPSSSFL
jgi:hypothetical protein